MDSLSWNCEQDGIDALSQHFIVNLLVSRLRFSTFTELEEISLKPALI